MTLDPYYLRQRHSKHFGEGGAHVLSGVKLSARSKRTYSYSNPAMSKAQEIVFGGLIAAHEAEIYRVEPEPRHSLSAATSAARLPVHKSALRVYEHLLLMDELGDTVINIARAQAVLRRHVDHVFEVLKQRNFLEPALDEGMFRLTPLGRSNCGHVADAKERDRDARYRARVHAGGVPQKRYRKKTQ